MKRHLLFFVTILILLVSCKIKNKKDDIPKFEMLLTDSITYFKSNNIPKNKPIILFYFGAYCDHSRTQIERIIKRIDYFQNVIILLMTDDPYEDMISFYKQYRLKEYSNFIVGIDCTQLFKSHYKVNGYPYIAIYDKDRNLIHTFNNERYAREIIKCIEQH